jgi:hypothetical protein
MQHLESNGTVEGGVEGFVDCAKAAVTDLVECRESKIMRLRGPKIAIFPKDNETGCQI